jgi:uncharacterized membrane protein YfcA
MEGPRRDPCLRARPAGKGSSQPGRTVTDFFTTTASLFAEPRFIAAVFVTALAGIVRGFSGFGSALIYIPLIAAIYDPRIAAVTLLITDSVASLPFTVSQTRRCNWREVAPVSAAAIATIPLGAMALQYADPVLLRWGIACLVIGLLAVLVSGWRYHLAPSIAASIGVGLFAGFGTGAVQVSGPLAIIYWLGGPNSAAVVRANLMVYFALLSIASIVVYYLRGLFTIDVLVMSLVLGPIFIATMSAGAYLFRGAGETAYRRIAYAIIALSAAVSLPLFDELFR